MTKREVFIDFIDKLMQNYEGDVPADVTSYLDAIRGSKDQAEKPKFTDNGKAILQYLQSVPVQMMKARDIAEGMFVTSKTVSGAMRKLVDEGYIEKVGKDPVVYVITEKGKSVEFEENGEN